MACLLMALVAALLPAAAALAAAGTGGVAVKTSSAESTGSIALLAQIQDTLRDVLRSTEDEGRAAAGLFSKRQHWCMAALQNATQDVDAAATSLATLNADVGEHEAALEEAQGTVQQIQADMDLVQHTVKQTEDMLKVLEREDTVKVKSGSSAHKDHPSGHHLKAASTGTFASEASQLESMLQDGRGEMHKQYEEDKDLLRALIDNKHESLASLQGELEVTLPAVALLQARVAETKCRIADRTESVTGGHALVSSLRSDCKGASRRMNQQASGRVSEAKLIEQSLQALKEVVRLSQHTQEDADQVPQDQSSQVSFVQLGRREDFNDEDVLSLLGGQSAPSAPAAPTKAAAAPLRKSLTHRGAKALQLPHEAPTRRTKVRDLLAQAQLRSKVGSSPDAKKHWCDRERRENELVLRLAQDALGQLTAEAEAYEDADMQLAEDLDELTNSSAMFQATSGEVDELAERERALIENNVKNQQLAVKILAQAISILAGTTASGVLGEPNDRVDADIGKPLEMAKASFEQQVQAAAGLQEEALSSAQGASSNLKDTVKALERERMNVELLRERHDSQRSRRSENQAAYQAEANEATAYLKKLAEECALNASSQRERQLRAQVRALEDTKEVLDGRQLASLERENGVPVDAPDGRALSPLERAAREIGVSTEGN